MCVYRNFTCDNRISQPTHSYMYMPDEVFRDWKSIRIKEEEVKESIFSAIFFLITFHQQRYPEFQR
jgi:hypothetical protein